MRPKGDTPTEQDEILAHSTGLTRHALMGGRGSVAPRGDTPPVRNEIPIHGILMTRHTAVVDKHSHCIAQRLQEVWIDNEVELLDVDGHDVGVDVDIDASGRRTAPILSQNAAERIHGNGNSFVHI